MLKAEKLLLLLHKKFSDCKSWIEKDQVIMEVPAADLIHHCTILRSERSFEFEQLIDICGVDYLSYGTSEWETRGATSNGFERAVTTEQPASSMDSKSRFEVVYNLLSVTLNHRLRLKVTAIGDPPMVPSVIDIWKSADWYEREAFDLFGILFKGHPDLRRLLTDYGFVGHPFRKDYPLIGEVEMRYDAKERRVVYEPVSIEPRVLVPKTIRKQDVTNG